MNFLKIFSDSFQDNWNSPSVTSLASGLTLEYSMLAARMARMHCLLDELGIKRGSRVAISGENSIDWVTAYMGIITSGRTAVVIPPFYTIDEVVAFSGMVECEYLFVDAALWNDEVDMSLSPDQKLVIALDCTKVLYAGAGSPENTQAILANLDYTFIERYPLGFHSHDAKSPDISPDFTIAIFLTAGTTGTPKAVMLSADSLEGNTIYGIKHGFHPRGTATIALNTFGNIWGCVFDLMVSLASGAHIYLSPVADFNSRKRRKLIARVKPYKILLSPRQIHGIYESARSNVDRSPLWKRLKRWSAFNALYQMQIRRQVNKLLGGRCVEIIIGASALPIHIEWALRRAKIRFTAVYGLTECGGIVAYTPSAQWRPGTVGCVASNLMNCRLKPVDIPGLPEGAGELQIRGMTVMKGYYGEDELTRATIGADGWLSTGDIATISPKGLISILGRIDSIIHTPTGPIFPEKLELMLITQKGVKSAIVVDRDGVLTAILEPDYDYMDHHKISRDDATVIMRHAVSEVNRLLALNEHIDKIEVAAEPLLLTAKATVRRYEYF